MSKHEDYHHPIRWISDRPDPSSRLLLKCWVTLAVIVILVGLVLGIMMVSASAQQFMTLRGPCSPSSEWIATAKLNGATMASARIDEDGDAWIVWENGPYWWLTLVFPGKQITCIISGNRPRAVPQKPASPL